MSDGVLAAIIAACATVFASFLQLKASFAKELATRSPTSSSRRKSRLPFMILVVMLGGAAVGGFALSQWLTEHERVAQSEVQRALQERINTMTRTESALEKTRAEIQAGLLREQGMQGVVVMATVGPCKPSILLNTPALAARAGETPAQMPSQPATAAAPSSTCMEAEASPITLCASIPAQATLSEVELYVRPAGTDTPWSTARVMPGQEVDQSRFAEKPTEVVDDSNIKQVCEGFVQWSTERGHEARMLVRYTL
ncbi:MAG TPA: hypothetical protein VFS52_07780 [Steroidobacteraceae bacterium]|jgi:hypothetical protein|nr:hypothetical protein [Steroidobacteraceae bacterium]